jgi:hypothetical protein
MKVWWVMIMVINFDRYYQMGIKKIPSLLFARFIRQNFFRKLCLKAGALGVIEVEFRDQ